MTPLIAGANRGIGRALFDHYRVAGEPVFGRSGRALCRPVTGDNRLF